MPAELLDPSRAWADRQAYATQVAKLVAAFAKNLAAFSDKVSPQLAGDGPHGAEARTADAA